MEESQPAQEQMSDEEIASMIQKLAGTTPLPEEKHNVYTFLTNVAISQDTTKIGNLTPDELGMPSLPLRSDKSLALWSIKVMDNPFFDDFFNSEAEITTSTSLSKNGFLVDRAVLQRREIADITKPKKENKGWFHKKDTKEEQQ